MTAPGRRSSPAVRAGLVRRKLSGTFFLGACLLAIAFLLLALLLLLLDVLSRGSRRSTGIS